MKSATALSLSLGAVGLMALTGCVERKVSIVSDPPGALIYVNDVEVGHAPLTIPFQWYGVYDLRATYNQNTGTLNDPKVIQYSYHGGREVKAPVYQWLGIDLFAELIPIRFEDKKVWAIVLQPAAQPTDDQLVKSGLELKTELNSPTDIKRPHEVVGPPAPRPGTATTHPAATQPR